MHIRVLGAAAGGGYPQWNCNHPNSRKARNRDPNAIARTQSSIALSTDKDRWFIFNASPDLRQQLWNNPALMPKPEDPLRYMTAGEVTPSMMEGIVATDYYNRGYYDPTYINYAAKGGRVGRMGGGMGGGMMIIDDNDVVNNGMGAILNKYKQIRSEL